MHIPTWFYQHHDADHSLPVPEHAFGGWQKTELEFSRRHTAVVCMHAWQAGRSADEYPGWWRAVPYIPRANQVATKVFPPLLRAVRAAGLPLFHVVGGGDYYRDLPGYRRAVELAGPEPPPPEPIETDATRQRLADFKRDHVFVGAGNVADVRRGSANIDFLETARPEGDEGVAATTRQLVALCRDRGVNHLVYCGFAINWCLLLSPGGMAETSKHGILCSALRQATVAVENRESAGQQLCKELALWRVALAFGFVFDVDDFVGALAAG